MDEEAGRAIVRIFVTIMSKCRFREECVVKEAAEIMRKAMVEITEGKAEATSKHLKQLADEFRVLAIMIHEYFEGNPVWWV